MALKKFHGRPQIWTLNNISLPFPTDDTSSDQNESPTSPDPDDSIEE